MHKGFWSQLKKPFFVMAPMADVTDAPFRRLIAKYSAHERSDKTTGGPDVMWTEFVSADGLLLAPPEGRKKLMQDLVYTEEERPIVAQFFTSRPEHMEKIAALARELGFDGFDINMGCPDRSIEKQGCGAALIKTPELAQELVRAAMRGAGDMPVSVKTRVGYNHEVLDEWLPALLETNPAAITIHARTRKEMSKVPARWEHVARAVSLRDEIQKDHEEKTLILGNGDALSLEDAHKKAEISGADGVMLGRAIFGNPWLFHPDKDASTIPVPEKLQVMVEHTKLFSELLPEKNFAIMKKHYKAYVQGFDGAKELRVALMETKSAEEVAEIVDNFLKTL